MYVSTRGAQSRLSAASAIKLGMAADGGLLVPNAIPQIDMSDIKSLASLGYQERAQIVLRKYLPDYSDKEIAGAISKAYNHAKFDHAAIAPLVAVSDELSVLELWHGPTSAFKDMALQLLPQLLTLALQKTSEQAEIVILVATSGDTGKAALEGFRNVAQTKIIVFYPLAGVSEIQRLQMVTQEGSNTAVVAVEGNFDDAQTGVKQIFNDGEFNAHLRSHNFELSSANSINWGRLVPQIVYYFSAYADLLKAGKITAGQLVNFVVPTGNFGNILAGYYAKLMGLPINKLICASNANNVLTDFLQTGIYDRRRPFQKTLSPSMDILISSNLERWLYHASGSDNEKVRLWMNELQLTGRYEVDSQVLFALKQTFWAASASDDDTLAAIKKVYSEHGYVADPHTAVAWHVYQQYLQDTGDRTPAIIVSTASPFKFNDSVLAAISGQKVIAEVDEFAALTKLSQLTGWDIPVNLATLADKPIRHKAVCANEQMPNVVDQILKI